MCDNMVVLVAFTQKYGVCFLAREAMCYVGVAERRFMRVLGYSHAELNLSLYCPVWESIVATHPTLQIIVMKYFKTN